MSEEIVNVKPEDIQEAPKAKSSKPTKTSRPGFETRPDPQIVRRADFDEVMEDARLHQEALNQRRPTTPAGKYVSILFTPAQVAYLKARIKDDKAGIADEIIVKLESAL